MITLHFFSANSDHKQKSLFLKKNWRVIIRDCKKSDFLNSNTCQYSRLYGIYLFFRYEFIETHALTFLTHIILAVSGVSCDNTRRGFVPCFFVIGRVLRHFCNVLLQNNENVKQNLTGRKNKVQNQSNSKVMKTMKKV